MKNLFILFILTVFGASCKKAYTCQCSTTTTFPSSVTQGDPYTTVNRSQNFEYSAKMKRKQAEAACEQERQTISSIMQNGWTENGSYNYGIVSVTTCDLD